MSKAVGIDLGTTNSVISFMDNGEPTVIVNKEGARTTPSVVAFSKNGEKIVGIAAKRQAILNPDRTIISIKRHMGTDYKKEIDGKKYTPEEISAMILQKLKTDAEEILGEKITKAVITVPAYFNNEQRTATKHAGEIAGLEVLRIINEPTAAALAYGLDKKKDEKILVFDLGGGTFDVSILEVGDGVFEVKSTNGDTHLGGDDWDNALTDWICDEYKKNSGVDLRNDKQAMQRVREAAEKAKIELSTMLEANINLPYITADISGPKHLEMSITRAKFEEITAPLLKRCKEPILKALEDAKITKDDIDEVVLVGGSTRMPMVQELIRDMLGKEPNKSVNPDEVVAIGAAIQAAVIAGDVKDIVLLDVTPLTLGVETLGGIMDKLIERNTTIPVSKSKIYSTAENNQTAVTINVLQGEREIAAYNHSLGQFNLTGIPPAPRGVPQIEVTFSIDANGIVNVSAKDLGTGKEQKITISGTSRLSQEEIERMIKEAEMYAEEDRKMKENIETKNNAEGLIYQIENTIKENKEKLNEQDVINVENKINELRQLIANNEYDKIKTATEALTQEFYKISQALYAQNQNTINPENVTVNAEPTNSNNNEEVIDTEFKATE